MINPEVLIHLPETTEFLGFLAVALAFSKSQKEAVLYRDQGKCQFPEPHNCNGGELQIHHIIPQRYCEAVGIEDPDFALNGITLCKNSHVGEIRPGEPGLHPDMIQARKEYGITKSFKAMFDARQEKIRKKQPYWNTKWDRLLHVIAVKNTQRAQKEGWVWPEKRKHEKGILSQRLPVRP